MLRFCFASCVVFMAACGGASAGDSADPASDCALDEVRDQACGLNGNGSQAELCQDEGWTEVGTCDDPDECTNDAVQPGTTACGLSALDGVLGTSFIITNNSQVSPCEAQAIYDGLSTRPATVDFATGNGLCP